MINNRQNGRRRGRGGGQRPSNNAPNPGNRQDNRNRGNAAQLHEKYKALARDAQLAGDRVQTEYYLQFADHYYRILNENRARFEEQRPRRDDFMSDDDEDQDENGAMDSDDGQESDGNYQSEQPAYAEARGNGEQREDRQQRTGRPERTERPERMERAERTEGTERAERPERAERTDREFRNGSSERRPRQPRVRRERSDEQPLEAEGEARISLEVLPPAIAVDNGETLKPRRRTRRPRPEDEAEIAPAA